MSKSSFKHIDCSIAQTLEIVGDWWTLLIIRNAFHGMRQFDAFEAQLGISTNVLADRLRKLTAHGVFEKRPSAHDGRSFDYRLTEKGHDLYPLIVSMMDWGERWAPNGQGRRIELVETATGHPVSTMAVRNAAGDALTPQEVTARPGPGADETTVALISRSDA